MKPLYEGPPEEQRTSKDDVPFLPQYVKTGEHYGIEQTFPENVWDDDDEWNNQNVWNS